MLDDPFVDIGAVSVALAPSALQTRNDLTGRERFGGKLGVEKVVADGKDLIQLVRDELQIRLLGGLPPPVASDVVPECIRCPSAHASLLIEKRLEQHRESIAPAKAGQPLSSRDIAREQRNPASD